jgi:hypothetical protein
MKLASSMGLLSLLPLFFLSGCGGGKEAAAAGTERVHVLKARIEKLDEQVAALPRGRPEQLAALTTLKNKYNATKIEFLSKEKVRFGTIPDDLYQQLVSDLDEVEGMIRDYPR